MLSLQGSFKAAKAGLTLHSLGHKATHHAQGLGYTPHRLHTAHHKAPHLGYAGLCKVGLGWVWVSLYNSHAHAGLPAGLLFSTYSMPKGCHNVNNNNNNTQHQPHNGTMHTIPNSIPHKASQWVIPRPHTQNWAWDTQWPHTQQYSRLN
jgi:hypothetical protein